MIYTITLNPSLDYTAEANSFDVGRTNRTQGEYYVVGGKGLNVSILLSRLGIESTALGFAAGFTGKELEKQLEILGCNHDFIEVEEGFTRINVKLVNDVVTEFNGAGPKIADADIDLLLEKISTLTSEDTLVLSGSIPSGVDENIYSRIIAAAPEGATIILDTCGKALTSALSLRPFLIKPNDEELSDLFGKKLESHEDVVFYAKKLQEMGAQNVLVSLGEKGAVLLSERGEVFTCDPPKGKMVNTVGAGDSMVAGFIREYSLSGDYAAALKFSVCCGSATAYSKWLAEKELIQELFEQM